MRKYNKNSKNKKNQPKAELSGEALMADALNRISKINGKSNGSGLGSTFDEKISQNKISRVKLLTDLPQREEKTPSEIPALTNESETISSQKDYVDLKIGKEILNFEKKLIQEISDGKSSIQRWGIALIVGALLAAAGIMVGMQLFATQQLKDFIENNFTEKFNRAISETNQNIKLLDNEQQTLKESIESIKNSNRRKK